jgi:hypothetical protein
LFRLINNPKICRHDQLEVLLVEIQPFVVMIANDVLLLDTGLGFSDKDGKMQLHKNLQNAGMMCRRLQSIVDAPAQRSRRGCITG